MKVGVIGAGTMGQGIAKAFAQVDGYEVALCDIKQEWAEGGKDKIAKGYARLVEKGKKRGVLRVIWKHQQVASHKRDCRRKERTHQ